MRWINAALLIVAALVCAQSIPDLGFSTKVGAGLTTEYARKFGPTVPERFAAWMAIAKSQKAGRFIKRLDAAAGREADALQAINDAVNGRITWVDDRTHWGVDDYWATPAESYGSAGGDCEDLSIAKYYLLKELGVPLQRLRITYVRALKLNGQAHMVLVYYANTEAEPLVLDNLDPVVRGASQRPDLDPVYSFNDDEFELVKGKAKGKSSEIRAWRTVQEHLIAENRA